MNTATLRALPKVILHDHLDGGLRSATVVELARASGYRDLPTLDVDDLADWFDQGESGSLEGYLDAFRHTIAVMQTPEALARVATEAVQDLAADGVVYAEIRFAPSLHLQQGLSRSEVIAAVLEGIDAGTAETGIDAAVIIDAMRQDRDSPDVVAAALEFRDRGVVGFDLAGPEAGFPPTNHLRACREARAGGLHLTIHAGEADGPHSILAALDPCGAERIGHGVRIVGRHAHLLPASDVRPPGAHPNYPASAQGRARGPRARRSKQAMQRRASPMQADAAIGPRSRPTPGG